MGELADACLEDKGPGPLCDGRCRGWRAVAIATVAVGLCADAHGTQLGVPHPPFIGAYGPRATWWLILAVPGFVGRRPARSDVLRRAAARFAGALFVGTLILRLPLGSARQGDVRLARHVRRAPARRGQERVPAEPARVRLRPALLPRSLRRARARAAGALRRPPPGLLLAMHDLGIDKAPRLAAFCILVGALSAPLTYVLAQAALRGAAARIAGVLAALLARDAALRRDLRRRRLPHARPARRDPAADQRPSSARRPRRRRRCSPGRCSRSRPGRRSSSSLRDG